MYIYMCVLYGVGTGTGNDEGSFHTMAAQASIHTCAELCVGYTVFGLQYHNQCFCGNTYGGNAQDDDSPTGCNTPCNHPGLKDELYMLPGCEGTWEPACDEIAAAFQIGRASCRERV